MQHDYTTPKRISAFWSKVNKNGPIPAYNPSLGQCWLWMGALDRDGYGQLTTPRTKDSPASSIRAHRLAYELTVGPFPAGLHSDHLCRTRNCVRPSHIEPVTPKENTLRGECPSSRNARKTHCKRGHPFDETNTSYTAERNERRCRACGREYMREKRKDIPRAPFKTHCPQGHAYDVGNTRIYKGARFCRACSREKARQYRRQRRS
jgi:hypothetical protein